MISAHRAKVKKFQPFKKNAALRAQGVFHPLEALARYSDSDKHRKMQYMYCVPGVLNNLSPAQFVNCVPVNRIFQYRWNLTPARKPGDEVFSFPVVPTGPNPDVHFKANMTAFVALEGERDIIDTLDTIAEGVAQVLRAF